MEEFYTLNTDSTGNVCPHAFVCLFGFFFFGEIATVTINW